MAFVRNLCNLCNICNFVPTKKNDICACLLFSVVCPELLQQQMENHSARAETSCLINFLIISLNNSDFLFVFLRIMLLFFRRASQITRVVRGCADVNDLNLRHVNN